MSLMSKMRGKQHRQMDAIAIDRAASAMSDEEQLRYVLGSGWQWAGMGYVPSGESQRSRGPGGIRVVTTGHSGIYSLRTAVRECLARAQQGAQPGSDGRYYQGPVPPVAMTLTLSDQRFRELLAEYGQRA